MLRTRPDIIFVIGMLVDSKRIQELSICKQLEGSQLSLWDFRFCVIYSLQLTGFSDADWASDKDEGESNSGSEFLLEDVSVLCRRKKQPSIALSTMEIRIYSIRSCSARSNLVEEIFSTSRFYSLCKWSCNSLLWQFDCS